MVYLDVSTSTSPFWVGEHFSGISNCLQLFAVQNPEILMGAFGLGFSILLLLLKSLLTLTILMPFQ